MPQPGLVLSAGRRARKNSAAPHTRQRPPPLAVKCAELPPLPQRSTGRRNPIPQHPHSAANRIARRRRASPPTSRASVAGGANLAFADPRHPGARPTCARRTTGPRVPRRKPGEPVKGCSITGRAANGRRPPQAVQTLFAAPHPGGHRCQASTPHQLPPQPGRKAYESCNAGPLPEPTPPAADRSLVGGQDGAPGDAMRRRGDCVYDEGKGKSQERRQQAA